MTSKTRQMHFSMFKAKSVPAAGKGEQMPAKPVRQLDRHPNHAMEWNRRSQERAEDAFGARDAPPADPKALHANIGNLTLKSDLLERALLTAGWLDATRSSTVRMRREFSDGCGWSASRTQARIADRGR